MGIEVCPVCGGTERVELAAGFYECRSQRLVNAVPPGMGGNAGISPIPIFGPCGTRYPLMQVDDAGRIDRERRAAEERAARERAELDRLRQARIAQGTPGFPVGECSGRTMSAALERLVPGELHRYVIRYRRISPKVNYRHWGPAVTVEGWAFAISRTAWESNAGSGYRGHGLIVCRSGVCFEAEDPHVGDGWRPSPAVGREMYCRRDRKPDGWLIPSAQTATIRRQVAAWRGVEVL
jgi:hypothetical protein